MAFKKKTIFIFFIFVMLAIAYGGNQGLTLFGKQVYTPRYFTAECNERADSMAEYRITAHTDEPTFYHCNSEEAKKYIPVVAGVQCEYTISNIDSAEVYFCEGITKNRDDLQRNRCSKQRSLFVDDVETYRINSGTTIYINTNTAFGTGQLRVKYPSYGLRVRSSDGFVQETTTSCFLNTMNRNKYHTIDAGEATEVIPDFPFNVVGQLAPAISTQAVTLTDVAFGKPIYITRPGYYNLISEADDGFVYVDTTKEYNDKDIECIPRTTGCSDDAKATELQGQSCDIYGGAVVNYAPVKGDNSKLCKYSCTGGTLSVTNDCIEVKKSCPAETPLWDSTTGKCVSTIKVDDKFDFTTFILIAVVVGLIILIGVALLNKYQRK